MAFHRDRLEAIARPLSSEELRLRAEWREKRAWIGYSQLIALNIHYILGEKGITRSELAERMGVSPAYIDKILKGGENLTLEVIGKLGEALGESLITVPNLTGKG